MITLLLLFLSATPAFMDAPNCGPNEIYDVCGTACPPTCQLPNPDECPEICIAGCFCQEGFIRENLEGKCIAADDCESACRENEEYDVCGDYCTATCWNPSPSCQQNCCSQGCFCKEGYILDDATQTCVAKEECPKAINKK